MYGVSDQKKSVRAARTVAIGAALVLGVISLTSMNWLHMAANPATHAPAVDVSCDEIADLLRIPGVPSTGIERAYFHFLGWTLLLALVLLSVVAISVRNHAIAWCAMAADVVALVVFVLSVKGALSWGAFLRSAPDVRTGAWLMPLAFVVLGATALLAIVRSKEVSS
jgi:hypothetical protein